MQSSLLILKLFKRIWILFIILFFAFLPENYATAQTATRTEIFIPDIPGYITLKCDFHTHTVFSDGSVWPNVRPQEAWMEGLDAIAITDHIEYQPHEKDLPTNHGRSHEIAQPYAERVNMILVKGAEITKGEPPGHFNALFIEDIDLLDHENYLDAVTAANKQGGFVFWNHPGWKQPGKQSVWYNQQDTLFKEGLLHGMEVVNGTTYYPNVHQWCIEKNLTLFGNSDIHNPITFNYDVNNEGHRPMTLVFVKKKTLQDVKGALKAQRTAVYWEGGLIGDEEFLGPIFNQSVSLATPEVTLTGDRNSYLQFTNRSDVKYTMELANQVEGIALTEKLTLPPRKTVITTIRATTAGNRGQRKIEIPYTITNAMVAPNDGLPVEFPVRIRFAEENQ